MNQVQPRTLKELYQNKWYRLAKVIYIVSYVVVVLYQLDDFSERGYYTLPEMLLYLLFIIILFEAVRRGFYYVIFGTIFPPKVLLHEDK